MNGKQFYDISIRGRIAYVILCFENYVKVKYPDIDMHPVLKMMWSVVDSSDYIDNSAYRYLEIVPECLFEKDYYSTDVFEKLTEDEYNKFTKILNGDDSDLNTIMMSVYDIAMEYAYIISTRKQASGWKALISTPSPQTTGRPMWSFCSRTCINTVM